MRIPATTTQAHAYLSEEATEWERQRAERGITGQPEVLPWAPAKEPGGGVTDGDAASRGSAAVTTAASTDGGKEARLDNLVKPNIVFTKHYSNAHIPETCEDGTSYLVRTLESTLVQPGQRREIDTGIELCLPEHVGMQLELYPNPRHGLTLERVRHRIAGGETMKLPLTNVSNRPQVIPSADPIALMTFRPLLKPQVSIARNGTLPQFSAQPKRMNAAGFQNVLPLGNCCTKGSIYAMKIATLKNRQCISCDSGLVTSVVNPEGCRHAFCCDECLKQCYRCPVCNGAPIVGRKPIKELRVAKTIREVDSDIERAIQN